MTRTPTTEEQEDVIMAARFGDIDDVKTFVNDFGIQALAEARDESQNTVLHMASANGHEGKLLHETTARSKKEHCLTYIYLSNRHIKLHLATPSIRLSIIHIPPRSSK